VFAVSGFDEQLLTDRLSMNALRHGSERFLNVDGRWHTHAEMYERSEKLAAGLYAHGVRAGDRIASILPNRIESIDLLFACARLGSVHVPLNIFLKGEFLRYQLRDCDPSIVIADLPGMEQLKEYRADLPSLLGVVLADEPRTADVPPDGEAAGEFHPWDMTVGDLMCSEDAAPPCEVELSTLLMLLYTSGTTGEPKGCMINHGYVWNGPRACAVEWEYSSPGDTVIIANPLYHALALNYLVQAVGNPSIVSFERSFSASTLLDRGREIGATVFGGVGAMAVALLAVPPTDRDHDHPIKKMEFVPLNPKLQNAIEERFGVVAYGEMYGQTECNPATGSRISGDRKRDSCGRPLPWIDLAIVDDQDRVLGVGQVGEIVVRPLRPNGIFAGYWRKGAETVETWRNLWHHTGDLGRLDEDGYLYYHDRKKDSIRRRGENISSWELESAIVEHPSISNVAVHAVPSSMTEDDIKACIVATTAVDPEELFEFFRSALPYYAIPRYVEFMEELPTNPQGRIMKYQLRAAIAGPDVWDFENMGFIVTREQRR
jgi:crotonobetaine/carnitine-CoA ligase